MGYLRILFIVQNIFKLFDHVNMIVLTIDFVLGKRIL